MSVEESVYAVLTGDSDIAATVSTRVYPQAAPQGSTAPYVVYRRNTAQHVRHMLGSAGLAFATFDVAAWSTGYDEAKAVGEYVRLCLDNYTGTPSGSTTLVRRAFLESDSDDWEPAPENPTKRMYCRRGEYTVWYTEPST